MNTIDTDICIIGGGSGGLSVAAVLRIDDAQSAARDATGQVLSASVPCR